ncbi:MAG: cytochrome b/b6 domain-containing protein [Mizugakiibacter sp.]|uniref:cytochrome b/b6 domain-containing protein n=1 Tax=Mizugakiibacter sp. TaxID=1972610 RepID=UPI00320E23F7
MHRVKVWDLPTRLTHWALAALVLLQYGTAEWHWLSMDWHFRFGYATLALVLFRVAWGFAGSRSSRFADFVRGPARVAAYLRATLARREARTLGHNPLGGWSVLALLLCLAVQGVSGLFGSDDITLFGPLSSRVSDGAVALMTALHKFNRVVLLALVALHLVAVFAHLAFKRDNLIAPMLHGWKRWPAAVALRFAPGWRAWLLLAIAAALVWGVVAWGEAGGAAY